VCVCVGQRDRDIYIYIVFVCVEECGTVTACVREAERECVYVCVVTES